MTAIDRQFDLMKSYGGKLPFVHRSETSQAAAEAFLKPGGPRHQVFEFIEQRGTYGATGEEIQAHLRMQGSTQRPRCCELEKARLIQKSGKKRPTTSNRLANVYVVKWPTQEKLL